MLSWGSWGSWRRSSTSSTFGFSGSCMWQHGNMGTMAYASWNSNSSATSWNYIRSRFISKWPKHTTDTKTRGCKEKQVLSVASNNLALIQKEVTEAWEVKLELLPDGPWWQVFKSSDSKKLRRPGALHLPGVGPQSPGPERSDLPPQIQARNGSQLDAAMWPSPVWLYDMYNKLLKVQAVNPGSLSTLKPCVNNWRLHRLKLPP